MACISNFASKANKNHGMNQSLKQDQNQIIMVMVPLPAQGHLNQLLHLSHLISVYRIPIHFVGTATHNRQAKLRIQGWKPNELSNIHFHDFIIPSFPSPNPNPNADTKFPSHLIPSFRASSLHLLDPLTQFLLSLSSQTRRVIVVHDSLMASAVQGIVSVPNAESYTFHSVSAFTLALFCLERNKGNKKIDNVSYESSFPNDLNIPSLDGCFPLEFSEFVDSQFNLPNIHSGKIYNTSKVIEKSYLDVLKSVDREMKHFALGPFNPIKIMEKSFHFCLQWLDHQKPRSVIYISFGTTTAMEEEQIKEIANGLERSKQKFIWVLRDADKGDVFKKDVIRKHELPEGFEKRVVDEEKRGIIVRDWAPQLEILRHKSTGGFMTHCGWNSCMESLTMGIPIVGWPMHSDQPRNAVLMSEVLRVGVVVREWECRKEIVDSTTVENVVRKLMVLEEGREMRKRAAEIGDVLRRSVDDGGVSRLELDSFIAHITR